MREKEPQFFKEEIPEEAREKIHIERLEKLLLLRGERQDLILAYLGEKPVSTIETSYSNQEPLIEEEKILLEKEKLERALDECDLKFKIFQKEYVDENGFDVKDFNFVISKEQEEITHFEGVSSKNDTSKIGELLGFPKTACEAFSWGMKESRFKELMFDERKWWKSLPRAEKENFLREKVWSFVSFKLSKKHWQEELEIVRRWQKVIKEKAPQLYKETTKQKPEFMRTKREEKDFRRKEADEYLEKIREKVEQVRDNLSNPIEAGIKETVTMLNAFGIRTSQSCEGHFEKGRIIAPWVEIYPREPAVENWTENDEIREKIEKQKKFFRKKMTNLLTLFYQKRRVPFDAMLGFSEVGYGFRIQSQGGEILDILEEEKQPKKWEAYKKEMKGFTAFLKKNLSKYLYKEIII